MKSNKYAFRDIKNAKDKKDFLEFLRYQTTAEYGGNQIFDGSYGTSPISGRFHEV